MVSPSPARPDKFGSASEFISAQKVPIAHSDHAICFSCAFNNDYSVGTRGIAGADYAGFSWIGKIDCLDETYPFPKWSEKPLGELACPRRQTMRQ